MNKIISFLLLGIVILSCTKQDNSVVLKGELQNFKSEYLMKKGTPIDNLLKNGVLINIDNQKHFEVTFQLDEPAYFRLGRNTLFLSPGDKLDLFCDYNNPGAASYKGDGAEACIYLKDKPFPKGGSYLKAGKLLSDKPPLEQLQKRISDEVANRKERLAQLKNVSKRFIKLEEARIRFNAANSFKLAPIYEAFRDKIPKENIEDYASERITYFEEDIKLYLKEGGDADFLNLDVYRDICSLYVELLYDEKVNPEIFDYLKTTELLHSLAKNGPTNSVFRAKEKTTTNLTVAEYKKVIETAFKKFDKLSPGNLAPALEFTDKNEKIYHVSDFKGKTLVIDVWATWCVPCIEESPFFESLSEKYKGKDIEFISISIDSNKSSWEKFLNEHEKSTQQFITNKTSFSEYLLSGIPRFIIIDKKGNIIDAFASAPSKPEFEQLIINSLN